MQTINNFKETADYIKSKINIKPEIAIVLGSGLGELANRIKNAVKISYTEIPNFPQSTVEGHAGQLIAGDFGGKKVIVLQGRFHYYEGYSMDTVTYPIRIFSLLGVKNLIVSNAAGGINPDFNRGDIMVITDHINFFPNPLIGKNLNEFGTRFPVMSDAYSKDMITKFQNIAKQNNISLKEGVYIGSTGPTLETPAEYNMFRLFGADATGMSTVPEVIVARHCGMECFGFSVITNIGTNVNPDEITDHKDVQAEANKLNDTLALLVEGLLKNL